MALPNSQSFLDDKLREVKSDINFLESKNQEHKEIIDANDERLENLYKIEDDLIRSIALLNKNQ
jgi:hypothetical protein